MMPHQEDHQLLLFQEKNPILESSLSTNMLEEVNPIHLLRSRLEEKDLPPLPLLFSSEDSHEGLPLLI